MEADSTQVVRPETETYSLGDTVPVPGFDSVPPGTNVLIAGSSMLGKQRLALGLLAAGTPVEHAIVVSPDTDAKRLHRAYENVPGGDLARLHVVDCTGTGGSQSQASATDVKYVSSPGDLTGIGVGIVKATRDVGDHVDEGLRLALLSLSTVTRYTDAQRAFNFLHTVTGRVSAADYLGVATIDPDTHSPQELSTITSLFDAVVELDGERRVVRTR